jgi:hypothetical protein
MVRGNEFFLIPLACIIGVVAGLVVTVMSEMTQIAHTVIYGIPLDVRLSATVHPLLAVGVALALDSTTSMLTGMASLCICAARPSKAPTTLAGCAASRLTA